MKMSKRIRRTNYRLRARHAKSEEYPGPYLEHVFGTRKERIGPIPENQIVELRDFLSVYIKERITKDRSPSIAKMIVDATLLAKKLRKLESRDY